MKLVTHTQGSDAWKAWRRDGIGGSDVAAILGVSPYTDPPHTRETVFAEKVHGIERPASFAMHRGARLEPSARDTYQRRRRCTAPPVCVEMDGCPWARVSLDGLAANGAAVVTERLEWVLELKCPSWETHDLALAGVVPEHFMVQCQWQMYVTGLPRLDFASFNPHERFTPESFPLLAKWRDLPPGTRKEPKPSLLDLWLALPPKDRPPQPEEWLAVHAVEPDHAMQAWIWDEVGPFWFEVLEARAAKERAAKAKAIEAQFA